MMGFLSGLFAFIACGACFGAFWVTYQLNTKFYSLLDRIQTVEEGLQRMRGKLSANDRWSRDEIRDAVDTYLQGMDLQQGGASMEDLLPMLMQMQMGQPDPRPQASGTPGDGAPSDVAIARYLAGKGGKIDE